MLNESGFEGMRSTKIGFNKVNKSPERVIRLEDGGEAFLEEL